MVAAAAGNSLAAAQQRKGGKQRQEMFLSAKRARGRIFAFGFYHVSDVQPLSRVSSR